MARRAKAANGTSVLSADRASPKPSIRCTTVARSPLRRFAWFSKLTVKAAVYVAFVVSLDYETVVSVIDGASHKAQMIHNQALNDVDTQSTGADEFGSFVQRSRNIAMTRN